MQSQFENFRALALPRRQLWRVGVGSGIIVGTWLLWTAAVFMTGVLTLVLAAGLPMESSLQRFQFFLSPSQPSGVVILLTTFAGLWIGLWLVLKTLHKRPLGTVLSAERRLRLDEFTAGFALAIVFWLASMSLNLIFLGPPERSRLEFADWVPFLLPLIPLIAMQAASEEMIFRGYLLQQLAARFRSPWLWALLPSLVFGALHYNQSLPGLAPAMYVASTTIFALTMVVLVWRTGSISAPIGLHIGVNFFSVGAVGVQGILDGAALWRYRPQSIETLFFIDLCLVSALLFLVVSSFCPIGRPIPYSRAPGGRPPTGAWRDGNDEAPRAPNPPSPPQPRRSTDL